MEKTKINKLAVLKDVAGALTGAGAGTIIKYAVDHVKPENQKTFDKVTVFFGVAVLSSMVGSAATEYLDKKIDKTIFEVKNVISEIKKTLEETKNEQSTN